MVNNICYIIEDNEETKILIEDNEDNEDNEETKILIEDNEETKTPTTKDNKLPETNSIEEIVITGLAEYNNLRIELHIQHCGWKEWILENLHNLKVRKLSLCNIKNFLLDYDDYSNAFSMKSFADKDLKRMVSSPLVSIRLSIIFIYTIRTMQFE